MGLKDYFNSTQAGSDVAGKTLPEIGTEVESEKYIKAYKENRDRFIPHIDVDDISSYVKYGSARKYFEDSIYRIIDTYPYDGSGYEKLLWENSSTFFDLHVFNAEYPKVNGHVILNNDGLDTGSDIGSYHTSSGEYILLPGPYIEGNIVDSKRGNNLKLEFSSSTTTSPGSTIEFWLKKDGFSTTKEVVFDLWNGNTSGSDDYGRLTIEVTGSNKQFVVTCLSGTSGFNNHLIGSTIINPTAIKFGLWEHHAFRITSDDTSSKIRYYKNGSLIDTQTSSSFGNITTSNASASIGSLIASPSGSSYHNQEMLGFGGLSGSLDEFRFWKEERNSKQIGRNWFTQVDGGTNLDNSNYPLTVYYKFNEGIVGNSSYDKTVLDYSGREMHATWYGYPGSSARSTDSAFVLSGVAESETKDPIKWKAHPEVQELLRTKLAEGLEYDDQNSTSFINFFPSWVIEEDEDYKNGELKNLVQVIASYFDYLHFQIDGAYNIKEIQYLGRSEGTEKMYHKPFPFTNRLVSSMGMPAPNIFVDTEIIEFFKSRDEDRTYRNKLHDIKNLIYQNIYNNLSNIYKTKGTRKSFRNFLHCFGIDDELVRINLYSDNDKLRFDDTYRLSVEKKNYADFLALDNREATVVQSGSIFISDARSFISGTSESELYGFTTQAECYLPILKLGNDDSLIPTNPSCSLFGSHEPAADLSWATQDSGSFQVYAILGDDTEKSSGYFYLTSSAGLFAPISSSVFPQMFTDKRWNIAVRVKTAEDIIQPFIPSAANYNYDVEFYGVSTAVEEIIDEFYTSVRIDNTTGSHFVNSSKRLYVGAHRQDFTGSVLCESFARVTSLRHWGQSISNDEILEHAKDSLNYGTKNPLENTFFFSKGGVEGPSSFSLTGSGTPSYKTLALHWDFNEVLPSPVNDFIVTDVSSGSHGFGYFEQELGDQISKHHSGVGHGFGSGDKIKTLHTQNARKNLPEVISSEDMTKIIEGSDFELFGKNIDPVNYFIAIEKSMYQNISEEMINLFSTIKAFDNLVGEPVYRYRGEYKSLEKLRQLFFQKVSQDIDFERFVDFYKWFDYSINIMLEKLLPASSKTSNQINTVVESHILERNKFRNKFPTIENKDIDITAVVNDGQLRGVDPFEVRQQLIVEGWSIEHMPLPQSPPPEYTFSRQWRRVAEKDSITLTTGDPVLDASRQSLFNVMKSQYDLEKRRPPMTNFIMPMTYEAGHNNLVNKKRDFYKTNIYDSNIQIPASSVERSLDTDDFDDLRIKEKLNFQYLSVTHSGSGEAYAPLSIFRTRRNDGGTITYTNEITNLHDDTYGDRYEKPLQGPFTNIHVGTMPHRRQFLNLGTDDEDTRSEAFRLSNNNTEIRNNHLTERSFIRDVEGARRPYNTKNIRHTTGSGYLGNYQEDYEVALTNGRKENNLWFRETEGGTTQGYVFDSDTDSFIAQNASASATVGGLLEYLKPSRNISKNVLVSRFSAPGGPETGGDSDGGPGLDFEAAEYSVYNTLNYRNQKARTLIDVTSRQHAGPFGFSSFEPHTSSWYTNDPFCSFHKTNRNPRTRMQLSGSSSSDYVTGTLYDNNFVQTPIPAQDYGYSWIAASTADRSVHGHALEEDSLTFVTASDVITEVDASTKRFYGYHPRSSFSFDVLELDFIGLNSVINNKITLNPDQFPLDNVIGETVVDPLVTTDYSYQGGLIFETYDPPLGAEKYSYPTLLNSIILNRQGPYGWPTWKQIRGGGHPIRRYENKNSIFSFVKESYTTINGEPCIARDLNQFVEPMVTNKYRPLSHDLILPVETNDGQTDNRHYLIDHTYGNYKGRFPNLVINKNLYADGRDTNKTSETYATLLNYYLDGSFTFNSLIYPEIIYPREVNTYLARTRGRENFTYSHIWDSDRTSRIKQKINSFDEFIINTIPFPDGTVLESVWPLDSDLETLSGKKYNMSGSGELQNIYATFQSGSSLIKRGALYNRRAMKKFGSGSIAYLVEIDTSKACIPGDRQTLFSSSFAGSDPLRNVKLRFQDDCDGKSHTHTFAFDDDYSGTNVTGPGFFTGNHSVSTGSAGPSSPAANLSQSYDNLAEAIEQEIPELIATRLSSSENGEMIKLESLCDYIDLTLTGSSGSYGTLYYSGSNPTSNSVFCFGSVYYPGGSISAYGLGTNTVSSSLSFGITTGNNWNISSDSGYEPYYTSYDSYSETMRTQGKEYSIIPEFRMSEHINFYLTGSNSFFDSRPGKYTITGSTSVDSSNTNFYKEYLHSDFLKFFKELYQDHRKMERQDSSPTQLNLEEITLVCKGYKKILPYEGFYPATRATQIMEDFWGDFENQIKILGTDANSSNGYRPILSPLFAPGVLFNSIKSGIAVDYPIYTGSYTKVGDYLDSPYDWRVPFESVFSPDGYLGGKIILDQEPETSASIDVSASLGQPRHRVYEVAMHNYLSEVQNFFLQSRSPKVFSSKPLTVVTPTKDKYIMKVRLSKGDNFNNYRDDYAFGPPVSYSTSSNDWDCSTCSNTGSLRTPYTPPYFEDYAEATITFPRDDLSMQRVEHTLSDVIASSSVSFQRYGEPFEGEATGLAMTDYMNLSASVNLFNIVQDGDTETWKISPKFESPILHVSSSGGFGNMWYDYAQPPENEEEKLILSIHPPEPGYEQTVTGSLIDLIQFDRSQFEIGEMVQDYTEVSEAVVAIPFMTQNEEEGDKFFFEIDREAIDFVLKMENLGVSPQQYYELVELRETPQGHIPGESLQSLRAEIPDGGVPHPSIAKSMDAMRKYVFPPEFDFIKNRGFVSPIVMFVFEFSHKFSREDLVNIWQNVLPVNTKTYGPGQGPTGEESDSVVASCSHPALKQAFFNPNPDHGTLRWMVFKVKQRARHSYRQADPFSDNIPAPPEEARGYSHNWPYDYFSLVELIKIEAQSVFGNERLLTERIQPLVEMSERDPVRESERRVAATDPYILTGRNLEDEEV